MVQLGLGCWLDSPFHAQSSSVDGPMIGCDGGGVSFRDPTAFHDRQPLSCSSRCPRPVYSRNPLLAFLPKICSDRWNNSDADYASWAPSDPFPTNKNVFLSKIKRSGSSLRVSFFHPSYPERRSSLSRNFTDGLVTDKILTETHSPRSM